MEVRKGGGFQKDGGTDPARRIYEQGAQSYDETIARAEIRGTFSRTVEDQQLLFKKNRFGNNGTDAAASQESGNRYDDVDEKDDDVAH